MTTMTNTYANKTIQMPILENRLITVTSLLFKFAIVNAPLVNEAVSGPTFRYRANFPLFRSSADTGAAIPATSRHSTRFGVK